MPASCRPVNSRYARALCARVSRAQPTLTGHGTFDPHPRAHVSAACKRTHDGSRQVTAEEKPLVDLLRELIAAVAN